MLSGQIGDPYKGWHKADSHWQCSSCTFSHLCVSLGNNSLESWTEIADICTLRSLIHTMKGKTKRIIQKTLGLIISCSDYVFLELNDVSSRNIRIGKAWSILEWAVWDLLEEFKASAGVYASFWYFNLTSPHMWEVRCQERALTQGRYLLCLIWSVLQCSPFSWRGGLYLYLKLFHIYISIHMITYSF